MAKPHIWHCKLGTQPASIVIKGRPNLQAGARIQFRLANGNRGVWNHGIVDEVRSDGFLFVSYN